MSQEDDRRIGLRPRVSMYDDDPVQGPGADPDPPKSGPVALDPIPVPTPTPSDEQRPVATPSKVVDGTEVPPPARARATSDPMFASVTRDIARSVEQPPASVWAMGPPADPEPEFVRKLPDAGPNGPSQLTTIVAKGPRIVAEKPGSSAPASQQPKKAKTDWTTRLGLGVILGVILGVSLLFILRMSDQFFAEENNSVPSSSAPSQSGITPEALSAFTNGAQNDPGNYTPIRHPTLTIACPSAPPRGNTRGLDVRACLITQKPQ